MENATFEKAIEIVKALPAEDRERFSEWFRQLEYPDSVVGQSEVPEDFTQYQKAQEWLTQNRAKFIGQWVCLEGDHLIAHGTDALQVHAQAKAAGIRSPFIEHITEDDEPFLAGWE